MLSPIVVLILGWRQRFTLLWLYAAAGLIFDNVGEVFKQNGINHHISGNIFNLIELIVILAYFQREIFKNDIVFWLTTVLLTIGYIAHTIYSDWTEFNFVGLGVLCAMYIVFGVLGYVQILRRREVIYLSQLPQFWINTAFFLYASSNCLLFLFATYLKQESFELMIRIWYSLFVGVNIMRYVFIGVGLRKTGLNGT